MERIPRRTTKDWALVLDVDETLIHSEQTYQKNAEYRLNFHEPGACNKVERYNGKIRPYLREFFEWAFRYFRVVAIYSAGEHNYVWSIMQEIYPVIGKPLHAIYTQRDLSLQCLTCKKILSDEEDDCTCKNPEHAEIREVKPLAKFWDDPVMGRFMKPCNTVIVDDRSSVFRDCNPLNGLQLPAWKNDPKDDALLRIMRFFQSDEVLEEDDVRNLDLNLFEGETRGLD